MIMLFEEVKTAQMHVVSCGDETSSQVSTEYIENFCATP